MADGPAQEIKEKLDVVDVLRGYLTLQPAGRNFKGLCPFHKEKSPSFMVSPDRQSWHCFGCGIGGDIFSFVMRYENVEFGDALRILADKAGIELRKLNPAEHRYTGLLLELNHLAKEFFRSQLNTSEIANKYLEERGLKKGIIAEFELGWAPPEAETLTLHLLKKGHRPEDVIQAGLSFRTERGMLLDRFRGRIMFPIHNHLGKPVGFTGRVLPQFDDGRMGKYVNSPETPIFTKSKLLYGFWATKNEIREQGSAFLVEGQMDFLMSYQVGIKNAIATSGTALTLDHLKTIRRLADKLVLSFDSDQAGQDAGERAIDLAEATDFEVRVASLGKYKDPGEMGQAEPESLLDSVKNARPAPEFYFDKYLPKSEDPDRKDRDFTRRLRAVLKKLKGMTSPVEQSRWMKELSRRVQIEEAVLREEAVKLEIESKNESRGGDTPVIIPERSFSRWELLSQRLISALFGRGELQEMGKDLEHLAEGYKNVVSLLQKGERASADPATDELLNTILLLSEEPDERELASLKDQLLREYLKEKRRGLALAIKKAERVGDSEALSKALEELKDLPAV